jgi:hypothetical protein
MRVCDSGAVGGAMLVYLYKRERAPLSHTTFAVGSFICGLFSLSWGFVVLQQVRLVSPVPRIHAET